MFKQWKRSVGFFVAIILLISFVNPASVFAQSQQTEDMEKKCKATREGTETDKETKKRSSAAPTHRATAR